MRRGEVRCEERYKKKRYELMFLQGEDVNFDFGEFLKLPGIIPIIVSF